MVEHISIVSLHYLSNLEAVTHYSGNKLMTQVATGQLIVSIPFLAIKFKFSLFEVGGFCRTLCFFLIAVQGFQ